MKSLKSKLFDSKSINESMRNVVGGNQYTDPGSDTNANGGQYDVLFMTYDKHGSNGTLDSKNTGTDNTDAPTQP